MKKKDEWKEAALTQQEQQLLDTWKRDLFEAQQRFNLVQHGFRSVVQLIAEHHFPSGEWTLTEDGRLVGRLPDEVSK